MCIWHLRASLVCILSRPLALHKHPLAGLCLLALPIELWLIASPCAPLQQCCIAYLSPSDMHAIRACLRAPLICTPAMQLCNITLASGTCLAALRCYSQLLYRLCFRPCSSFGCCLFQCLYVMGQAPRRAWSSVSHALGIAP